MGYLIMGLLGYLLGCSNMAFYLSKIKKVDLRKGGSGNLGASNAMVLMGWKAGITVGLHDALKATLAVVLARLLLFPALPHVGAVAGVAAVLVDVVWKLGKNAAKNGVSSIIVMAVAFVLVCFLDVNVVAVILGAVALGVVRLIVSRRKKA